MGRALTTYRGARRIAAREEKIKFPWHDKALRRVGDHNNLEKAFKKRPVPNPKPPDKRKSRNYQHRRKDKPSQRPCNANFTTYAGLMSWWTQHPVGTHKESLRAEKEIADKKKAKLAASKPKVVFFYHDNPEGLAKVRARHIHPRHKREQFNRGTKS